MRRVLIPLVLSILSAHCLAQEMKPGHQLTAPVPNAKFEILQSPLAARWTFRVDRFTGRVWQLVKTQADDNMWEEMPVEALPKSSTSAKPRFQLFSSGLAARHTFLLDTETGKTWVVVTGKRKRQDGSEYDVNSWQLVEE